MALDSKTFSMLSEKKKFPFLIEFFNSLTYDKENEEAININQEFSKKNFITFHMRFKSLVR